MEIQNQNGKNEVSVSIPVFHAMVESLNGVIGEDCDPEVKEKIHDELLRAYLDEISIMYHYASRCSLPNIRMYPFRKAGSQWIADFSVSDFAKQEKEQYNFHLQNTSRWVYAGCILYQDGEISRHH